jgi:hypothetical protein
MEELDPVLLSVMSQFRNHTTQTDSDPPQTHTHTTTNDIDSATKSASSWDVPDMASPNKNMTRDNNSNNNKRLIRRHSTLEGQHSITHSIGRYPLLLTIFSIMALDLIGMAVVRAIVSIWEAVSIPLSFFM